MYGRGGLSQFDESVKRDGVWWGWFGSRTEFKVSNLVRCWVLRLQ